MREFKLIEGSLNSENSRLLLKELTTHMKVM